ncbi:uncharacterized protein [Spinacia oleracea]|uniref:Retrotransposon gag domain-containing protein n=1 Tax=Spinacia oleracea TaxID=3562 RepID=A0A9R0IGD0_SPIOL|nr:uncharacterized protein LOC110788451 [Spinacia oleracea]
MFKNVAQSKPRLYQGEIDPSVLENWLKEFDKLILAVNCPEDLRVNSVVYYLRGEADLWWKRCENALRATPGFGWELFKVALRNKFYPPYLKKQKAQELIELRMEGMSITEYYSKFIELSRFAHEVLATEELRAQIFESGLTMDLQMMLAGETFTSLNTQYGKAAHLYGLQ